MTGHWLEVMGIGEDGETGLSPLARQLLSEAEVIIGGDRHHALAANKTAERIAWPSPFDAIIDTIKAQRGRRVIVLVTGDPLWYSVGARILKSIPAGEIRFHPQLSAFQLAACRMGWSLADVETLTIHGRPAEQIVPFFSPGSRMLILTKDETSPATVAQMLSERGYGLSAMTVLAALGGPEEKRLEGRAENWSAAVPAFHTLAVECRAGENAQVLPWTGLPDTAFRHDGKMTKRAVRALSLAKLVPQRGALLWDIGCGCGSVAIEWMRAAPEARAIGIEPLADRRAMAMENAVRLGAPSMKLLDGAAPTVLAGLAAPDAVFVGGGISMETIDASIRALKPLGRLVANAVTLESEAVLLEVFRRHGGELERVQVQVAEPVGGFHGWKPAMPVTQWHWQRRGSQ